MAFSVKQLLFCIAVLAFGLVALLSDQPVMGTLFESLTLGILSTTAYGAWLSYAELRAFRVGFLCWAALYFMLFKKRVDVGVDDLINRAYRTFQPETMAPPPFGFPHPNFTQVFHSLFLLLLGVVG